MHRPINLKQIKKDYLAESSVSSLLYGLVYLTAYCVQGLPFPILTVGEYFTVDAEGFCWGRNYRQAGYYTSIFLW